jgi:predicted Fe-Mo cluster-binding NifX family protein
MACWKWFDGVLKDAGVKVTKANRDNVDEVIHHYIGEQSSYGNCSADWKKARKEVQANPKMRQELVNKLKALT